MDVIVLIFLSLVVLRGIAHLGMAIYFGFFQGAAAQASERTEPRVALLRRIAPPLIAVVLVALYLCDILTGVGLFLLASALYACELGLMLFFNRTE